MTRGGLRLAVPSTVSGHARGVRGFVVDPIVLAAGTALVSAMATDVWQQARARVVALWRRVHPQQADTVEADLEGLHAQVLDARQIQEECSAIRHQPMRCISPSTRWPCRWAVTNPFGDRPQPVVVTDRRAAELPHHDRRRLLGDLGGLRIQTPLAAPMRACQSCRRRSPSLRWGTRPGA